MCILKEIKHMISSESESLWTDFCHLSDNAALAACKFFILALKAFLFCGIPENQEDEDVISAISQ